MKKYFSIAAAVLLSSSSAVVLDAEHRRSEVQDARKLQDKAERLSDQNKSLKNEIEKAMK